MFELTLNRIAEITGGKIGGTALEESASTVTGISTDSRNITIGALFAAIVGERVDGHDFAKEAFENGAVAVLASRAIAGPHVLVPSGNGDIDPVIIALGKLSATYRKELQDVNVIGITGSSGKTSTKDIVGQVLSFTASTVAPSGSPNNELGLPLTILSAPEGTKNLVLEMGMRGLGHIEYLCKIAKPNIVVVTNVGQAHIGEVGSIENIQKAKAEIVAELAETDWAILNFDDPNVLKMRMQTKAQVLTYGLSAEADIRASNLETTDEGFYSFDIIFHGQKFAVNLPLLGEHNVFNALAAFAVGTVCGMDAQDICSALAQVKLKSVWRMERHVLSSGITVINDAYNANPESMAAALRTLTTVALPGHAWAILGQMAELGEFAVEQHDAIGRLAVRLNITQLVVVGEAAKPMYLGALQEGSFDGEAVWFPDFNSACDYIKQRVKAPDVLLFKASRAARFEQLAEQVSRTLSSKAV